jgi:hypothetical protein
MNSTASASDAAAAGAGNGCFFVFT